VTIKDDLVLPRKINAANPDTFGRTAEEHSSDTYNMLLKVRERLNGLRLELDTLEATVGGIVTFPGFGAPAQGIGGANAEGTSPLVARADHDHLFRETSGPSDLRVAGILADELFWRSGFQVKGRQMDIQRLLGTATRNAVALADVSVNLNFNLKDDAGYLCIWAPFYSSAAATTGMILSVNYTGTFSQLRYGIMGATGATGFQSATATTVDQLLGQAAVGPGGTTRMTVMVCYIRTTTAGVLALRWASGVAGSDVNMGNGSPGFLIQAL